MSSYNSGAQYEIIGRISDGSFVSEYVLRNRMYNTIEKVEKHIVEQMALDKQIYNCKAQRYNNIINLKGINCKISQMPKYDKQGNLIKERDIENSNSVSNKSKGTNTDLEITGKVYSGREVTEYILKYIDRPEEDGMIVPRYMVIQLVKDGRIKNTTCQKCNNTVILRGNLSKVESIRQ
jgi:hypothetical protein